MRTQIIWAELHSPLFLAGTNLQQKLDPHKRQGLHMEFDEEKRHLYVSYAGKTARVPEPSILSMVEEDSKTIKHSTVENPTRLIGKGAVKAQASSPQDHVFAGAGKGKTGLDEALKKL